ncbi:MAG: hypothetical protein GY847_03205 [Proteobacteria bacterium]|nr:hypothetical protein [Pseudomonadota bacterium]
MERVLALAVISVIMYWLTAIRPESLIVAEAGATLSFGFLILCALFIARLLLRLGLPKITGYIIAGMLFGPSVLGFLSHEIIDDLKLVDDLALTFIAFAAGGELRLAMLKERRQSIGFTLLCLIVVVLGGITFTLLAFRSFFPFTAGRPFAQALAIAAICAVIAVARSPSSAIAIISETKARGPFTEMVLGVTVAADVLTIFLFAVVVSLCELAISVDKAMNFFFLLGIVSEVVASVIIGIVLGRGIALYLEKVRSELPIFILGMAFMVTTFSQGFASLLDEEFGVFFHLEPMLICLTAGFFVQNFSELGKTFLQVIDRSSLPIYAIFFAISGAALRLEALERTWHWALVLVALRGVFIYAGTFLGGRLSSDPVKFQKASGLGFITQAGVSLGLAKIVAERFEGFGPDLATLFVATIAINQILGPVAFKQALQLVGETKAARVAGMMPKAKSG